MSTQRDIRRCALQCLYQLDAGAAPTAESLGGGGDHADLDRLDDQTRQRGLDLATLAWEFRDEADGRVAPLTPEWPHHRQPMIDRNILRLAWFEVVHQSVPARVVINECVELAKEFGSEKSPAFVNGVLDRLLRERLEGEVG